MSLEMMLRALYAPPDIKGGTRLVLIALADHADDENGECYPSMQRIAFKAAISERQARRAVEWLEKKGYVARVGRRGNTTNIYRLKLPEWRYPIDRTPTSGLEKQTGHPCPTDRTSVTVDRTPMTGQTGHPCPPIPQGTHKEPSGIRDEQSSVLENGTAGLSLRERLGDSLPAFLRQPRGPLPERSKLAPVEIDPEIRERRRKIQDALNQKRRAE